VETLAHQESKGKASEKAAKKVGVGHSTLEMVAKTMRGHKRLLLHSTPYSQKKQ
jgi:hypothetical protein